MAHIQVHKRKEKHMTMAQRPQSWALKKISMKIKCPLPSVIYCIIYEKVQCSGKVHLAPESMKYKLR